MRLLAWLAANWYQLAMLFATLSNPALALYISRRTRESAQHTTGPLGDPAPTCIHATVMVVIEAPQQPHPHVAVRLLVILGAVLLLANTPAFRRT